MKWCTPNISWHQKDPIYTVDVQAQPAVTASEGKLVHRVATAGVERMIKIWFVSDGCEKPPDPKDKPTLFKIEFRANLKRHDCCVNVARFSPDGHFLASGDVQQYIFLWQLSDSTAPPLFADDDEEGPNAENWVVAKPLKGHVGEVFDLAWSPDSKRLISGSHDRSVLVWDVEKGERILMLTDYTQYPQGVVFDPFGQTILSTGPDRCLYVHDARSYSLLYKTARLAVMCESEGDEKKELKTKLFHDELTYSAFYRRLAFFPGGSHVVVPAGVFSLNQIPTEKTVEGEPKKIENENKNFHVTWLFSRADLTKPVAMLPSGEHPSVAVRTSPVLYELRTDLHQDDPPLCPELPYRVMFAVITRKELLIYDTQQTTPIFYFNQLHYEPMTDVAWTSDGLVLLITSVDGFITMIRLSSEEVGPRYEGPSLYSLAENGMLLGGSELRCIRNVVDQMHEDLQNGLVDANAKDVFDCPECDLKYETLETLSDHHRARHSTAQVVTPARTQVKSTPQSARTVLCETCGKSMSEKVYQKHTETVCPVMRALLTSGTPGAERSLKECFASAERKAANTPASSKTPVVIDLVGGTKHTPGRSHGRPPRKTPDTGIARFLAPSSGDSDSAAGSPKTPVTSTSKSKPRRVCLVPVAPVTKPTATTKPDSTLEEENSVEFIGDLAPTNGGPQVPSGRVDGGSSLVQNGMMISGEVPAESGYDPCLVIAQTLKSKVETVLGGSAPALKNGK